MPYKTIQYMRQGVWIRRRQFYLSDRRKKAKAKRIRKAKPKTTMMSYRTLKRLQACNRGLKVWHKAFGMRKVPLTAANLLKYLRVKPFKAMTPYKWVARFQPSRYDLRWLLISVLGIECDSIDFERPKIFLARDVAAKIAASTR